MNILYLQPYLPSYRIPLFEELGRQVEGEGGTLTVAAGTPTGDQKLRGDDAVAPWRIPARSIEFSSPAGPFRYRQGLAGLIRRSDVCVMELDPGNLNAWVARLIAPRTRLVLWGHGKTYVSPARSASDRARTALARTASHVMTYAPGGRTFLLDRGIPADRVTTVGNATDTLELQRLLTERRMQNLSVSTTFPDVDLRGRNVFCYVGGLDESKRIGFLLEAARHAAALDPRFLLLVAGSGRDTPRVEAAVRAGHVLWTPHADARAMADLFALSRALWVPGRIGLIGVEALAAGLPILTTPYPFHAPEAEFLREGRDRFTLPDDPTAFARAALDADARPGTEAGGDGPYVPTVQDVARRMVAVLRGRPLREPDPWAV